MMKHITLFAAILVIASSCSQDIVTGNWQSSDTFWNNSDLTKVDRARGGVASFQIGNYGYAGLGQNMNMDERHEDYIDSEGYMKDFWRFDPASGNWSRMADFPGANRRDAVAFSIGGYGFVGLGRNEQGEGRDLTNRFSEESDFYRFTPPENGGGDEGTWVKVDDPYPGIATYDGMAFTIDNTVYVGTGYDDIGYYNNLFLFTIDAEGVGSWNPEPIHHKHKARGIQHFTLDNEVYFVSGFSSGSYLPTMWKFDGTTWTEPMNLIKLDDIDKEYNNVMRRDGAAFTINGKGYIVMGNRGNTIEDVWEYNPEKAVWIEKSKLELDGRNGFACFNFDDGVAYIGLGDDGWNAFDDVVIFNPDASLDQND